MSVPEPIRGDIWSFLPTVAGRDKPSALGADRVLVLSTSTANALLPTVLALPVVVEWTARHRAPLPAELLVEARAAVGRGSVGSVAGFASARRIRAL